VGRDFSLDLVFELVVGLLAFDLVGDLVHGLEVLQRDSRDGVVHVVRVVREHGVVLNFLRRLVGELLLGTNEFHDERLRGLESLRDDVFVGLDAAGLNEVPRVFGRFGLNHHDGDVVLAILARDNATGNDDVEDGERHLVDGGECNPGAVDEDHTNTGDGTREREARDLGRRAGSVDREGVVELTRCDREDSDDDLNLVAKTVDERRTQRAVDETADEDRFGRGASFASEERAGDLARGVRTLFDVYGQREEVESFTRLLARAGRAEKHGFFVEICGYRTLRLLRKTARLESDDALAVLTVIDNGLGKLDFGTFH
jgi:hypothetical protein